jgi:protein-S-isoprenylcysteine O-methyltransferase Ste14
MTKASEASDNQPSGRSRIRVWVVAFFLVSLATAVHVVVPWAISLLTPRYGWVQGRPGLWNLIGLIPAATGLAMIAWALRLHFIRRTGIWELEPVPRQMLVKGPYRFSRNPMYLLELIMWLGWAIFYGSTAVLLAFGLWWIVFALIIIPREERQLEARFGETYLDYKRQVHRWYGRIQRPSASALVKMPPVEDPD